MIVEMIDELLQRHDVTGHTGLDSSRLAQFEKRLRLTLPPDHKELLGRSNGLEAFYGYERLFGIFTEESIDSVIWNEYDYWQFAWGDRCTTYWCFAESVWGHQYAYQLNNLRGSGVSEVFELNAYSMKPDLVASSFEQFLKIVFLRGEPYDSMSRNAKQQFGPIDAKTHLTFSPPFIVLPRDQMYDLNKVAKMDARSAMILNGDAALQLDAAAADAMLQGFDTYVDDKHRARLKLLWSK
jgi:hypothetical protein